MYRLPNNKKYTYPIELVQTLARKVGHDLGVVRASFRDTTNRHVAISNSLDFKDSGLPSFSIKGLENGLQQLENLCWLSNRTPGGETGNAVLTRQRSLTVSISAPHLFAKREFPITYSANMTVASGKSSAIGRSSLPPPPEAAVRSDLLTKFKRCAL